MQQREAACRTIPSSACSWSCLALAGTRSALCQWGELTKHKIVLSTERPSQPLPSRSALGGLLQCGEQYGYACANTHGNAAGAAESWKFGQEGGYVSCLDGRPLAFTPLEVRAVAVEEIRALERAHAQTCRELQHEVALASIARSIQRCIK